MTLPSLQPIASSGPCVAMQHTSLSRLMVSSRASSIRPVAGLHAAMLPSAAPAASQQGLNQTTR